jgi:endonuclease/exonuclease/phosphatase family metal-dependent hydrolase
MRRLPPALLSLLTGLGACVPADLSAPGLSDALPAPPPGALRVMTFNVRLDTPRDGPRRWRHRRADVAALIRTLQPDVLGLQEPLRGQVDDLAADLPAYAWAGAGRSDGRDAGEFAPVFYRTDRFTPDRPGSRFWDAANPRIATWVRLVDRASGDTLVFVNTHFDHVGPTARRLSARLIRERLAVLAGEGEGIVVGDLNTGPASPPLLILTRDEGPGLRDAFHAAQKRYGPPGTYTGFGAAPEHAPRIDFILVSRAVRVLTAATVMQRPSGAAVAPSDHRPVVADVLLPRAAARSRPGPAGQ